MKELLERLREPLNEFWHRVLVVCSMVATLAITVVEVLPTFLNDEFIPDDYKAPVRMVYSVFLGISIAAKLTRK